MTEPKISVIDSATWATTVATQIMAVVVQTRQAFGSCTVMLTGGRTAAYLYEAWAASLEFDCLRDVHFYFGDERCVPPDHPESNYGLAMRTLFQHGVPRACTVNRMAADQEDREAAADAYAQQLPDRLDVLLLSLGEDGHIASLFPHSPALFETRRRVVPVLAPKWPLERLTITPPVIAQAVDVFVMALGPSKAAVCQEVLAKSSGEANAIDALPARLVLSANWLLDVCCPE